MMQTEKPGKEIKEIKAACEAEGNACNQWLSPVIAKRKEDTELRCITSLLVSERVQFQEINVIITLSPGLLSLRGASS